MRNNSYETNPNINCIKNSVIKLIILTFVTFTVYYPIWFLKVRTKINNLKSYKKIGSFIPIIVLILTAIYMILAFLEGFTEGFGPNIFHIEYLSIISDYLGYVLIAGDIALLIQCFKIRTILLDHYGDRISISIMATFFFQIFYLQYKINKL